METDMKKGQIVEGIVEHVDFPNKGVVLIEETNEAGECETHRVEVKGVIPGQKLRVSIKKARKGITDRTDMIDRIEMTETIGQTVPSVRIVQNALTVPKPVQRWSA